MNLVIITGTTRGLGKALAARFRTEGWTMASLSRPDFSLERAGEQVPPIFTALARREIPFQRTVLINNAASIHIEAVHELRAEIIASELTANIIGSIQLMTAFLQKFPHGEIVDITSGAVTSDTPGWSLYAVSKAAVARHIQALAAEGHDAWTFNPGVIDTDMQEQIRSSEFSGVERFRLLKESGQLAAPADVAQALFDLIAAKH